MRAQSVAYIEMEFIRGRSLADILKEGRGQPMPLEWTARILEQLCAVLHEAHGHVDETTGQPKPIIHRDLKPSNLMLVERKDDAGPPRLKVLDFGIAKIVEDDASPDLTSPGDLLGTPAYMSPEQIRGGYEGEDGHQEIDGRSDLYSTGVVLYHLLTGALPFRGGKMALLAAQLHTRADADEGGESQGQCPRRGRAGGDAVPGEGSRRAPPERARALRAIPPGRRHRRGRFTTRCRRRHGPMAAAGRRRRGDRAGLRHRPGRDDDRPGRPKATAAARSARARHRFRRDREAGRDDDRARHPPVAPALGAQGLCGRSTE